MSHADELSAADLDARFWPKVDAAGDCWLWTAARTSGYGVFTIAGRNRRAHRVAYELLVGPIPGGLDIDHLCRNKLCVNPDHLEPVTERINTLRGTTRPAKNVLKTHCPHGHPYDAANTYSPPRGGRYCKECMRFKSMMRKRVRRAAARAALRREHDV